MVFALFLLSLFLFFSFALSFYFTSPFSCSYSSLLFILFLFCFCFRPHKPELNPKPRTLHPIADGPFRWTPPPVNPPPPDNPPKISLFFPSSRHKFSFSLSWGPLVEFCWCLKRRGPEMCTFGLSGCRVKSAPPDRAGVSHDSPRNPNVHISGPRRFKHHQTSTKGPQERERRKKIVAGGGKKRAKFWAPHPSGLHPSVVP